MADSLANVIRHKRITSLIDQAETIRDYTDCLERTRLAEQHIREAMYLQTIGKIGQRETYRVFSLLSFVMPGDAHIEGEELPVSDPGQTEEPQSCLVNDEFLDEYDRQQARRACPSCGE